MGNKELKDIDLEDMEGMDGMHEDSSVEFALNKLGLVQDRIAKLKEQHDQRLEELVMKRNEVIEDIPEFWITANSSPLAWYFSEYEDYINNHMFSYLDLPTVVDDADGLGGYHIEFVFSENPYFKDTDITISVTIGNSVVSASAIHWKRVDKCLLRWLTEDSQEEMEDDRLKKIETVGEIHSIIKSPLEYYKVTAFLP
ncbi:NAP1-related protein 2 [Fagus crenata]